MARNYYLKRYNSEMNESECDDEDESKAGK
jgi:hypothetical protein